MNTGAGASPKKASFKSNAMWAVSGTTAIVLSQFITLIVLSRLLGPKEFGIVSTATLINQFALIFAEFGVGAHVVQRASLSDKLVGTAYQVSCLFGLGMAVLIIVTAPYISGMLEVPEISDVLRVYSITFLLFGAYTVQDALTQRNLDYHYLALADAASYLIGYGGVSICSAFMGFSYWSLVIGHICQQSIRCSFLRMRHKNLSRYPKCWEEVRSIHHFGFGQTLSRIGSFFGSQADSFVVASHLGVVAIGNYGRANQLATMPAAQLGQIFDKLIFPYISRLQNEQQRTAATYLNAVTGICALSIPAAFAIWVCGENIVSLLLGPQWKAVVHPLQILALAIPFRLIHKVSDPTARAMGKTYSRAWRQWAVAISLLGFSFAFSHYGLSGVAWGVVAAAVLDAVLMVWLCMKVTGFKFFEFRNALLPGLTTGLVVFFTTWSITNMPILDGLGNLYLLMLIGSVYIAVVASSMRIVLKTVR